MIDLVVKIAGSEDTNNNQSTPVIGHLTNNHFVVIWQGYGQDGSNYGIFGQIFAKDFTRFGNEFQVNTYSMNAQSSPSVTILRNGNFVVVWTSWYQDGADGGIFGQIFTANGSKVGNEFQVNNYTNFDQRRPSVASLSNGNFIVTWVSDEQDGSWGGIFGQLFNDNTSILITSSTMSTISPSRSNGKRTIVWISLGVGGLLCFVVAPLGLFLLRKRKSQTETQFSEEAHLSTRSFELEPVIQRGHPMIGKTYLLFHTIIRKEAEAIYQQTGHLIVLPDGVEEIEHQIGRGQFGTIQIAQRIEDGAFVVAKQVTGEKNIQVSEAEAQMQKDAAEDNVLPIYNTIRLEEERTLFHFMPLAGLGDGITMQKRLALLNQSPLAIQILTFIAQNILTGLMTIHGRRICHLDMKPDNLVFTKDGTAYVTDFGCAKKLEDRQVTGEAIGDNRYFSPERLGTMKK